MKNKVLSLTKVFLKNSFQNMKMSNSKKQMTSGKKAGMIMLYVFLFLYLASIFGFVSYGMITGLSAIHQEKVFLGIFFLAIAFLLIFQSIFTAMNVFYFSKDIEYVLPLPLKPREILQAKLNTVLVTEYITEIIFGVVPLCLYGILTGASVLYYIMTILVLAVFPLLPIVIASFLVMIVMSFAKFSRNRDKFQLIATAFIIIAVLAFQMLIGNTEKIDEEQAIAQLVQANGMVEMIGNYFITLKPAIEAMTGANIGIMLVSFIKVVVMTAVVYAIFILMGEKLYLRGAVGNTVGASKKTKKLKEKGAYKQNKIAVSYIKKELKILIRNPIFFMQCVLPAVLMPVIFLIAGFGSIMSTAPEQFQELQSQMIGYGNTAIAIGVVLGIIQFLSMLCYVAATAISRDGLNAMFIKYVPLSLYKQFIYKALPNVLINSISIIIVLIIAWYTANLSIITVVLIFAISLIMTFIQSYLMEIVDLKKPKLDWDTEYAVVKQNMNLIWPAVLGLVNMGIIAIVTVIANSLNYIVFGVILILIFITIFYFVDRYVKQNTNKLFEKIY